MSGEHGVLERLTTAQAVVRTLEINGLDHLFCLPGVQNDPLFDALFDAAGRIRTIHTRHEQGAAYMATGAALATGRPSAYCVVPGPGFLNTTAALATAYGTNAKVLALLGQIPSAHLGRGLGLLHEIPDQLGVLRSLTKWAERIRAPVEAAALVDEAFRRMQSGRPRPVGLECAMDVWARRAAVALPDAPAARDELPIDDDAIEEAARILGGSQHPLIVVGGGAQDAGAEVLAIARMLEAPVTALRMGQGVVDGRAHLFVSAPAAHELWASADAVLAVGTRLQSQQMNWGVDDDLAIVRVDLDPEEIERIHRPTVGIIGDAAPVLSRLLECLPRHNRKRPSREEELRALSARTRGMLSGLQPQLAYLEAIRAALPDEGILVDDLTQVGYVARFSYPVPRPRTFISPGYQGTLGWGFAAALGVKVARPDVPVLSIAGDGGFMFNVQELATAIRHDIRVVTVVFNDGAYGNVRRIQKEQLGNRLIASDLANPDFVRLAESFGAAGQRATSPDALRAALERAFALDAPVVIEVPCGEMPSPWGFALGRRVRGSGSDAAVF